MHIFVIGRRSAGYSLDERETKRQRHREAERERERLGMVSDELFSGVTQENLLDTIYKGMAKVKENQKVGFCNSRESPPSSRPQGQGREAQLEERTLRGH